MSVVVWLTGLPSSGKTTLARVLARALAGHGRASVVLDGDEVRDALVPHPGYTHEARDAFYDTLGRLAALVARQGVVALVPATAPRREHRAWARERAPHWVEVYVSTPLGTCEARDDKGHYARARAAATNTMPGLGSPYEVPDDPDVVATPDEPHDELALRIVALVLSRSA